jgi:hypothetical protein
MPIVAKAVLDVANAFAQAKRGDRRDAGMLL